MSMRDLGASTAYIVLSSVLAQFGRKIVQKSTFPAKELFYEAIAAAEMCATCFELIIVAENFGVATYAIYLFMLTVWWCQVWDQASACPYTHLEDLVEGNCSVKDVALKTWAELMGGCLIWRFVQFYWWLELTETHEGKAWEPCAADLQVHPYLGAAIEGIATMMCRIASKSIAVMNPRFATILDCFIGTTLVVLAFNYSGGYFNPVLATALKWGCSGHTNYEHIIVYWIGACAGALLSIPTFKIIRAKGYLNVDSVEEKEKQKEA